MARIAAGAAIAALMAGVALAQSTPEIPPPAISREAPVEEAPDPDIYLSRHLDGRAGEDCLSDLQLGRPALPGQLGEATQKPKLRRLVMAIDSSGSMAGQVGGERKIEAAKRAALDFLSTVPTDVEVGLIVFGHKGNNQQAGKAESCSVVETLLEVAPANRDQVSAAIGRVRATGWTPLAAAIDKAGTLFQPTETAGEQVVYVISDGVETCGGKPVEAARKLKDSAVKAIVNIIGFDIAASDRAQLQAVAQAGGGAFVEARTGRELAESLSTTLRNNNRASTATLRAANADSTTRLRVANAQTKARLCIANLTARETLRVNNALSADTLRGRVDTAFNRAVNERLKARHDRLNGLLGEYVAATDSAQDRNLESIRNDLQRALADPAR